MHLVDNVLVVDQVVSLPHEVVSTLPPVESDLQKSTCHEIVDLVVLPGVHRVLETSVENSEQLVQTHLGVAVVVIQHAPVCGADLDGGDSIGSESDHHC